jgi:hypothetical protein
MGTVVHLNTNYFFYTVYMFYDTGVRCCRFYTIYMFYDTCVRCCRL